MATRGKVRSLVTRPYQSSDLAFEIAGVIDWQNPVLKVGSRIVAGQVINVDNLVGAFATRGGDPLRSVLYNGTRIQQDLAASAIFRLRNHQEVIGLNQTILHRDIQYSRIYKNAPAIATLVRGAAADQVVHAGAASTANKDRHTALKAAYEGDPEWQGVRKTTQTKHTADGTIINELYVTPVGMQTPGYRIEAFPEGPKSIQQLAESAALPVASDATANNAWVKLDAAAAQRMEGREPKFYSQRTLVKEAGQTRTSVNTSNEFWHPRLENELEFQRLQSQVRQEEVRAGVNALATETLEDTMRREFELMELEVLKNQTRMLTTYLLPSYSGVITAIYKDVGEHVQPGEAVLRLENDDKLFLVGIIQLRGAPQLGKDVRIASRGIFETGDTRTYTAKIVAVRGHVADDDEWELLLEMNNPPAAAVPLNFGFDPGTTTIDFL